ncbi:MAG: hypothetical protein JWO76_1741 [Nocardioides sp.]|nr:hypothetical protein [Nocardioides sp.]
MTDQQIMGALRAAGDDFFVDGPSIVAAAIREGHRRGRRRAVVGGAAAVAAVAAAGVAASSLVEMGPLNLAPADAPPENAAITLADDQRYAPANIITLDLRAEDGCLVSDFGVVVFPRGTTWVKGDDEVVAPDGTRLPLGSTVDGAGSEYALEDVPAQLMSREQAKALARCADAAGTRRALVLFAVPAN